jgi:hypothetical protein
VKTRAICDLGKSAMLPRVCLILIAAFVSLPAAFAVTGNIASVAEATAVQVGAVAGAPSVASSLFRKESPPSGWNERTDEQDEPDRFLWDSSPVIWPRAFSSVNACRSNDPVRLPHPACAAPARGPPAL